MILADIQKKAHQGEVKAAEKLLVKFLSGLFDLKIISAEIRDDSLSLNSVNGFINLAEPDAKTGTTKLFFKFHHEENEDGLAEYYNSKLLADYGFPVELPVYASHEVGKQVLLYPVKTAERMADISKRLDAAPDTAEHNTLIKAQQELDILSCKKYLENLHEATLEQLTNEPILQLFHTRLTDNDPAKFGGRYAQFYEDKVFELPGGIAINFTDLKNLNWRINGIEYKETLIDAFTKALTTLAPAAHLLPEKSTYPAVAAHGDAHNGNVWFNTGTRSNLTLFDPAFAGHHIPALLAEIKATFHNIFAHPLWLYDTVEADKSLKITAKLNGNFIEVTHNWQLSSLRQEFLKSKQTNLWQPLIAELNSKSLLPPNWESYMRSALFCCPTLVMNLRANQGNARNSHTPQTSALGLVISIMLSSRPSSDNDIITEFFTKISP